MYHIKNHEVPQLSHHLHKFVHKLNYSIIIDHIKNQEVPLS